MSDTSWPPVVFTDGTGRRWVPESELADRERELAHLRASHSRLHDYLAEKFGECPAVWTVGNGSPAAFLAPTNKETE